MFFSALTGILPIGAESGADAEAWQDEAVEDEPPRDDDDQKQTFVHNFPLLCALPLRSMDAGSGKCGDKNGKTGPCPLPHAVTDSLVPKPGLEPGRVLPTTPQRKIEGLQGLYRAP